MTAEVHIHTPFNLTRYIGVPTGRRLEDGRRLCSGIMARRQAQFDKEHPPRVFRPMPETPDAGPRYFGNWQQSKQANNWMNSHGIHPSEYAKEKHARRIRRWQKTRTAWLGTSTHARGFKVGARDGRKEYAA